ncbi:MAG TPA: sulfurtransferase [Burkholderiaceae bacterium]|nr:sulfurtransferase [Burkholderiaceae bacterium]
MTYTTLIRADELRALVDGGAKDLVILDAGFDLAAPDAGQHAYDEGHLPGAHYVHLERDLSGPKTGRNGRHPLPDRAEFARRIARWGVTPASQVVVYDRQGASFCARAWWMLKWIGHEHVAVLDGGVAAWLEAGGTLTRELPAMHADAPAYPLGAPRLPSLPVDELERSLAQVRVVDARAPERYRGDVEPLDPVAGHIPGALNRFFKDNLEPSGRFRPADVLRADFERLLAGRTASEVVHQCGSGVTACHNVLAMEIAGLRGSRLYPGSWSEWCADPTRPVEKG